MRNPKSTASREIRQRNEQFSAKARAGKNPINVSRKEKLSKQSPLGLWALGIVLFVVVGGGGHRYLSCIPCLQTFTLSVFRGRQTHLPLRNILSSNLHCDRSTHSVHLLSCAPPPPCFYPSLTSRSKYLLSITFAFGFCNHSSVVYSRRYPSRISAFVHIPSRCTRAPTPGRALNPAPRTAPCPGCACVLDTFHFFCL